MNKEIKIAILGDIYPSGSSEHPLSLSPATNIFGQIPNILQSCDYVIGNLESPLTVRGNPIIKGGPNLRAKPSVINGLRHLGLNAVGIANNHILDYGTIGVEDTINTCLSNNIDVFGGGKNIVEAKKPHIVNLNQRKVAFIGFAEQEYSIAKCNSAGAASFDIFTSLAEITKLRHEVDFLIILYHGGIEHHQYPSPNLQRLCRAMVTAGADFVSCQHSHCIGASEIYYGKPILYGQGNFLFNYGNSNKNTWESGLIAEITFGDSIKVNYIPVTAVSNGLDLASPNQAAKLLSEFQQRSLEILDPEKLQTIWNIFLTQRKNMYFNLILGLNRYIRFINRITKGAFVRFFYKEQDIRNILNIVRCESHREVLIDILENQVGTNAKSTT